MIPCSEVTKKANIRSYYVLYKVKKRDDTLRLIVLSSINGHEDSDVQNLHTDCAIYSHVGIHCSLVNKICNIYCDVVSPKMLLEFSNDSRAY